MPQKYSEDIAVIGSMIDDMFSAISWDESARPDWDRFSAPCFEGVMLYPSARPVNPTALAPFTKMMVGQRDSGKLKTFEEKTLGHHVRVFGNIAVALSSFETTINGGETSRGVNGFLLIREQDDWKIVAICWDSESEGRPIPADLLSDI